MTAGGAAPSAGGPGPRTLPYVEVSDLVSQYLEHDSTGAAAALEELCDRHPAQADELRRRIRRLHDLGLAGGPRSGVHEVIGPFRVLGVLGEGGMGRVYLGQQSVPVRRLAAIKLMHPDRDARKLLQRFEAERQALAALNHPGIAQVLEAGTTPADEPWFAMEFVDGRPLTGACDEARLPMRRRIELFLQVCDAITHAHQNGVLHRDLKPGNVLVTERSGQPLVKVIDFGLAKLLQPSPAQLASLTLEGQLLGTPSYMSPEQAGVIDRPVDLRTDVYALGVMLYELLTGRLPLRPPAGAAGMAEMLRLLREVEPPPPSSAVAGQARTLAEARQLEPGRWARALAGDLDWIVGKALAKEPAQRYASVSELAGDLRRHLRDEPVLAGPPSTLYRLQRFVRRHRREAAVGALGLIGLLVALVYISVQAVSLSRELKSFNVLARELEIDELHQRAEQSLWPEVPERVPDMERWRHEVESLLAEQPGFAGLLEAVRARGRPAPGNGWDFDTPREAYLQDHIVALLASIEAFRAPGGELEQVAQREAWARGLHALTIAGASDEWERAIASIADPAQCPAYAGLHIEPQLGLVPLARNADSGLWEFAFPRARERLPEWVGDRWKMEDDTCLVFVLVPGGSFVEGAEGYSAQEEGGKEVTLDPFFLSKYEMTQGQWLRFTGKNPSRFAPPNALVTGLMHPVEQVSWLDCDRVVTRLVLLLPTGAQWEYAARAGEPSPWWLGPADTPPDGCGNLADARLLADTGVKGAISDFEEDYDDGWAAHAPVDAFLPNPFGLHNVIGNVWEWCRDRGYRHDETVPRPVDGLQEPLVPDPAKLNRQLRGGSFYSSYEGSRSTFFHQQHEENANMVNGLRPARALVPAPSRPEPR